ncbi:DNA-directed RNA polymerase sigma-70 factor [Pullulanibacillus camelliae]|uniref:DNA-directed RNA polymerase sigma-70 factor n=1 Tax=Pullulanibacillus camelliae TaxID=1707096 RepID=A0A8J2VLX4_9BACL|nr:sigma-70 family RNA polymerase sigma factor [Pullulanibacillus camelliae]GGE28947.1 DNA-directed RNA polymerase sigma-70 factor [Pullulanibacillus camelliae]
MQEELFQKAQNGNEAAFVRLLGRYQNRIYRIAYTYFRNEQDALDALQEVSVKAYKNIGKIRKPEALAAWLMAVTVNSCHTMLRQKKRETCLMTPEHALSTFEDHDKPLVIKEAISNLSTDEQVIIFHAYFEGLTLEEVANHMRIPIGTVKTRLHRALTKLRQQMRKDDFK